MAKQPAVPGAVEAEIKRIRSLGLEALRAEWRATFGHAPSPGLPKDLLARILLYRIQEQALGGLDRETGKLLDRLERGDKPGRDPERRLKAGTVLIREYAGERHTVTVVPGGFVWRDETYPSLSSIAKVITGTAWNGPRFFGLRSVHVERKPEASARRDPEPGKRKDSKPGEVDRPVPRRRTAI